MEEPMLTWAHWDPVQHAWTVLAAPLAGNALTALALPAEGGYALLLADAGATAPPAPVTGSVLPGFAGAAWVAGLTAMGSITPSLLPTAAAINGASATAAFTLSFGGQAIPSATLIQTDVLQSYTLVNQPVIEPDAFTQDVVASQWLLEASAGTPVLTGATGGLGLHLPVRMSRTFAANQLVQGRILVGFYHDGTQLADSGSDLIGAGGGSVSQNGVTATLAAGAVTGTTLVRVATDSGDLTQLWPELAGQGTPLASFSVDVVGTLQAGLGFTLDGTALAVPAGARPLLLQRRSVQGQNVVAAVGELQLQGTGWTLVTPAGGNPVLAGGAFTVLAPVGAWDWVAGTTLLPAASAQVMLAKLGAKSGLRPALSQGSALAQAAGLSGSAATVADVTVTAGLVPAVSGPAGAFAVPAMVAASGATATVTGSRYDLGLSGTVSAPVPSTGASLSLNVRPFSIETLSPAEGAQVDPGQVLVLATSTAMDPASLTGIQLFQVPAAPAAPVPLVLGSNLSQDGRTLLLTPAAALPMGAQFHLSVTGLAGLAGGTAPTLDRHFSTAAQAVIPPADLSQIQLSYPDANLNITVTIPAGAVPPWSLVEIANPGLGSDASGVMPPSGNLVVAMSANLGDRLTATVQLRNGQIVTGTLSCYVAPDGHTTLGVDGGRVQGPGGLAITVPAGAVAAPVELQVQALPQLPAIADGAVMAWERTGPGLRISASAPVTFQVAPRVELPVSALPAGINLAPRSDGNGPVALFRAQTTTLPDGTQDLSHILMDTAQLSADGSKLVGMGGLRFPDPAGPITLQLAAITVSAASQSLASGNLSAQARVSLPAARTRTASVQGKTAMLAVGLYDIVDDLMDIFCVGSVGMPAQYCYESGRVYRNWNGLGSCNGTASATCYSGLPDAEVHRYIGTIGLPAAVAGRLAQGRMLATCDAQGRYFSIGGPDVPLVIPGQDFIALFGVDPRTGETSIDAGSPTAASLGFSSSLYENDLVITSMGGNPFDPTLTAPRMLARMVDSTGSARSVFAVGDSATLTLDLENGSQPVVRGNFTGALTQSFGSLPQSIPVTFTQSGDWHVDVVGWSGKPVQGNTSLDVMVTDGGPLGPSLPGPPLLLSRDPGDGDSEVDPSVVIKVAFNEPVMAYKSGFSVQVNGAAVDFTLLSNGQMVDGSPAQEIWIVPTQVLSLGSKVTVAIASLADLDQPNPSNLVPVSWSFTVRGADPVGTLTGAQRYTAMVLNRGTIYAIEQTGTLGYDGYPLQSIRMLDVSDPSQPVARNAFGCHGSWDPQGALYLNGWADGQPFYKHQLTSLRVATGVSLNGQSRDLLLVLSSSNQATEAYMWTNGSPSAYESRNNTVWVFDITGDAASLGENSTPKLLMSSSLGTLSDNWGEGLGSAGGVLGVVKLRGGLSLWDANAWQNSFTADAQTLQSSGAAFNGVQVLAERSRTQIGYFPNPKSLVASNGFYGTALAQPSMMSGVITGDDQGLPIGFAAMGYSEGLLTLIDGKVGQADALATFEGGGPLGMDGRIHDLSAVVQHEHADKVEVMSGRWQGPNGTEQGTLLLAGTSVGTSGHFWVMKVQGTSQAGYGASAYGYADLSGFGPGKVTRINPDPANMLVGVEVNNTHAWVFDLKQLMWTPDGPMTLAPIYDFPVTGAWLLDNGIVYDNQLLSGGKKLVVTALAQSPQEVALPVSIDIAPPAATALASGSMAFTATTSGAMAGPVVWSVEEIGGGNISQDGTYQAPATLGTFTVKATLMSNPSAFAEAKVTVAPVALSPQTASLMPGDVLPLQVQGHAPSAQASFSASGGSITPDGRFTAPPINGQVVVTYQDQGRTATAYITVTRGKGLSILPAVAIVDAGSYDLRVTLTSPGGNTSTATAGFTAVGPGTQSPEVWFSAAQLQADLGEDGPYQVSEADLILEEKDDTKVMATAQNLGQTVPVKLTDLDAN